MGSSESEFPSKKTPPLVVEKRKIQPVNLVDSSGEKTLNDKIMTDERAKDEQSKVATDNSDAFDFTQVTKTMTMDTDSASKTVA